MANVKLVFVTERSKWDDLEKLTVLVDGVDVGHGYYGGEPEDNTRGRDYSWVEEIISAVATKLGATVSTEHTDVDWIEE